MKYNTNLLVFLTWYQSHCSNPLVCRSSAVLSSWVSSAAVVVSSTTASTATSVHQRPLPAATSASASPIRPQIAPSERNLSDLPFCEILSSSDLSRAPTRRQKFRLAATRLQLPPRASTRLHAPPRAGDHLLTSALGDVICHVSSTSSADVIRHGTC